MNDVLLQRQASRMIRMLLAQKGMRQYELVALLRREGIEETIGGLRGKLNRGTFSFSWVLACCRALEVRNLPLEWLE